MQFGYSPSFRIHLSNYHEIQENTRYINSINRWWITMEPTNDWLRFLFDGKTINDDKALESLEMEQDDVFEEYQE